MFIYTHIEEQSRDFKTVNKLVDASVLQQHRDQWSGV